MGLLTEGFGSLLQYQQQIAKANQDFELWKQQDTMKRQQLIASQGLSLDPEKATWTDVYNRVGENVRADKLSKMGIDLTPDPTTKDVKGYIDPEGSYAQIIAQKQENDDDYVKTWKRMAEDAKGSKKDYGQLQWSIMADRPDLAEKIFGEQEVANLKMLVGKADPASVEKANIANDYSELEYYDPSALGKWKASKAAEKKKEFYAINNSVFEEIQSRKQRGQPTRFEDLKGIIKSYTNDPEHISKLYSLHAGGVKANTRLEMIEERYKELDKLEKRQPDIKPFAAKWLGAKETDTTEKILDSITDGTVADQIKSEWTYFGPGINDIFQDESGIDKDLKMVAYNDKGQPIAERSTKEVFMEVFKDKKTSSEYLDAYYKYNNNYDISPDERIKVNTLFRMKNALGNKALDNEKANRFAELLQSTFDAYRPTSYDSPSIDPYIGYERDPQSNLQKAFEEEDAAIEAEKKKKAGIRKKDLESFQNLPIPGYRAMPQI